MSKNKPLLGAEVFAVFIQKSYLPLSSVVFDTVSKNLPSTIRIAIALQVEAVLGHTLFNPDHLLKLNGGKPTLNMTGFQTLVSKAGAPKKPKETPDSLPPFPKSIQSPGVKVFDDVPCLAGKSSFYFWIH